MSVLRLCVAPGCAELVERGRCSAHRLWPPGGQKKLTFRERGYTARWDRARAAFLRADPFCAHCELTGRVTEANVADHVRPHRGNLRLLWLLPENLQPLCRSHHGANGARESGLKPCPHGPTRVVLGKPVYVLCGKRPGSRARAKR